MATPIYDELVALFPAAGLAHPDLTETEQQQWQPPQQDWEPAEQQWEPPQQQWDAPEPDWNAPEQDWEADDLAPDIDDRDDGGTTEALELPIAGDEPTTCYWCGVAIPETAERYGLIVTDPVGEDELMLTACSEDHAHHLRMRYRSAS